MKAFFIAFQVVAYLSLPCAAADFGPVVRLGKILILSCSSVTPQTVLSLSNVAIKASGAVSPVYLLKLARFADTVLRVAY